MRIKLLLVRLLTALSALLIQQTAGDSLTRTRSEVKLDF